MPISVRCNKSEEEPISVQKNRVNIELCRFKYSATLPGSSFIDPPYEGLSQLPSCSPCMAQLLTLYCSGGCKLLPDVDRRARETRRFYRPEHALLLME